MRKIIGIIGATLAIVAVMTWFSLGVQESNRTADAPEFGFDVSVQRMSANAEVGETAQSHEQWFEDFSEGDELDESAAAGDDGLVSLASGLGRIEPLHPPVPIPPSL